MWKQEEAEGGEGAERERWVEDGAAHRRAARHFRMRSLRRKGCRVQGDHHLFRQVVLMDPWMAKSIPTVACSSGLRQ